MTGCRLVSPKKFSSFFAINELKIFENRTVDTEVFTKKKQTRGVKRILL